MSALHSPSHRFCVAPMMAWTDRHCRYFHRQMSKHARLYTEMITASALTYGDIRRLLRYSPQEHPVALQLGGSDPAELARSARLGEQYGYDEINLNCGCPSDRVQHARFGACLMRDPKLVADCVRAMRDACGVPVTVKNRIGIDDCEEYDFLRRFVETVAGAGCDTFIIHARKAWLNGLSPQENRTIPLLQYPTVYRLKREFPQLRIIINGGIHTLAECREHLRHVDGVMVGREAYDNPYLLAGVDAALFGDTATPPTRDEVMLRLRPYIEEQLADDAALMHITRHILGLYRGQSGGRAFRRVLSERGCKAGADWGVVEAAIREVQNSSSRLEAA